MIKINLSTLLKERKMTQTELAKKTGVRKATINEMYWNVCEYIKLETIFKICQVLECDISDLLEMKDN